ncbi:MAG: sigma-54-dependent Fis family transcriptional regulator [Solirubrobacterales bacterium]
MNNEGVKYDFKASHKRCVELGVDAEQVFSKKIIGRDELQRKYVKNRDLILNAAPFMEQLCDFVRGSNFFALLTDEEGCILNALGDDNILSEAFAMKMIPGAYMDEENIGTNAMSIAITQNEPIQISGEEHYIKAYHKWTCSAASIKDNKGKIIGALNLTGYKEGTHLHTLGMVAAASNAIEQMMNAKRFNRTLTLTKKHMETVLNSIPIGIISCDIEGNIKSINKKALEIFGYTEYEMRNLGMISLVDSWHLIKQSLYNGKSTQSEEVYINTSKNKMQYSLSAYPMYNSNEDIVEIVFVLEELKKVRKLAGKIMYGQAYYTFNKIISANENFLKIIDYAKKISDSKSTVLIMGESGTGKELFAQSIHNYSSRVDEPFIAVNCGAIPRELIESELFGYEEGAFTGAKKGGYSGKFEMADEGTIFLDEIGEMPLDMQTKLLRVIEEGTISRIGGTKTIKVNSRIIAATNRDLKQEVEKGNFRKDLYYRLNVVPLYLTPLRERKEDIVPLIKYLMKTISSRIGRPEVEIPEEYIKYLVNYEWPGNVRELENVLELIINTETIPSNIINNTSSCKEDFVIINDDCYRIDFMEKQHIMKVLKKFDNNITNASKALGVGRCTLYRKIKEYSIEV